MVIADKIDKFMADGAKYDRDRDPNLPPRDKMWIVHLKAIAFLIILIVPVVLLGKLIIGYKWSYIIFAALLMPVLYHVFFFIVRCLAYVFFAAWVCRRLILNTLYVTIVWYLFCVAIEIVRCNLEIQWLSEALVGTTITYNSTDIYAFQWINTFFYFIWPFMAAIFFIKAIVKKIDAHFLGGLAIGAAGGGLAAYYLCNRNRTNTNIEDDRIDDPVHQDPIHVESRVKREPTKEIEPVIRSKKEWAAWQERVNKFEQNH